MASRPQRRKPENRNPERVEPVAKEADPGSVLEGLGDDDDSELAAQVDRRHAADLLRRSRKSLGGRQRFLANQRCARLGLVASVVI